MKKHKHQIDVQYMKTFFWHLINRLFAIYNFILNIYCNSSQVSNVEIIAALKLS